MWRKETVVPILFMFYYGLSKGVFGAASGRLRDGFGNPSLISRSRLEEIPKQTIIKQ